MMRKTIAALLLVLVASGIAWAFWQQELQYTLPTPVPAGYSPIAFDEKLDISPWFARDKDKPLFIHFFNPYCPCSKFNTPYFMGLTDKFDSKVQFLVVVPEGIQEEEARDFIGDRLPIIIDRGGMLASSAGVYSSPQAVLVDQDEMLYYRGNYNKSRYCTDKDSNYAEIALQSLISNNVRPGFSAYATQAYGCVFSTSELSLRK